MVYNIYKYMCFCLFRFMWICFPIFIVLYFEFLQCYAIVFRAGSRASGSDFGRILIGKASKSAIGPPGGRCRCFPASSLAKSGPEGRSPARKHYCVKQGRLAAGSHPTQGEAFMYGPIFTLGCSMALPVPGPSFQDGAWGHGCHQTQ